MRMSRRRRKKSLQESPPRVWTAAVLLLRVSCCVVCWRGVVGCRRIEANVWIEQQVGRVRCAGGRVIKDDGVCQRGIIHFGSRRGQAQGVGDKAARGAVAPRNNALRQADQDKGRCENRRGTRLKKDAEARV